MALDTYEDSLYGQILPAEWDEDSVSELLLLVDGEEEFVIEKNENSELLMDLIDRWVTLKGVITEEEEEMLRIKVRDYTVEDGPDYDDDDAW